MGRPLSSLTREELVAIIEEMSAAQLVLPETEPDRLSVLARIAELD